jgi:hypothetical protein
LGIIGGGFDVMDQVVVILFAFVRYWKRKGSAVISRKPVIQLGGKYCTIFS